MDARRILFLLAYVTACCIVSTADDAGCTSPQYLIIGTTNFISCSFGTSSRSLLWYNSADTFHNEAILTVAGSEKGGSGFHSGEFDTYPNGSLIINNVTLNNEGIFTAIVLEAGTSDVTRYVVDVVIVAPTSSRLPVIYGCGNLNEICFQVLNPYSEVTCTMKDARPPVSLSWKVRTGKGDFNVSSTFSITNGTSQFFTSLATTAELFTYSSFLALLVCKVDSPTGLLDKNESLILVQNGDETFTFVEPVMKFVENGTRIELNCTSNSKVLYLTWQVSKSAGTIFKNILVAIFVGGNYQPLIEDHDYRMSSAGSLIIDEVNTNIGGIYRCISSNGMEDNVLMYDLVVFVRPDPSFLIVDGCDGQQDCVLEMEPEGTLTCAVRGIRPQVELAFIESHDQLSNALVFYEKQLTSKVNGDVFDITLTSKYRLNDFSRTRVTFECKVIGTDIQQFNLSTKLDIVFLSGIMTSTEGALKNNERSTQCLPDFIFFFLGMAFLLLVWTTSRLIRYHICKGCTRLQTTNSSSKSEEFKDDLMGQKAETIAAIEVRHQRQLKEMEEIHQQILQRVHEANYQLLQQLKEETTTQQREMKGKVTFLVSDVPADITKG